MSGVRKKLALDQREAAEILGVGINAFHRYETRSPSEAARRGQQWHGLDHDASDVVGLSPGNRGTVATVQVGCALPADLPTSCRQGGQP
jgi:hypothetical protein